MNKTNKVMNFSVKQWGWIVVKLSTILVCAIGTYGFSSSFTADVIPNVLLGLTLSHNLRSGIMGGLAVLLIDMATMGWLFVAVPTATTDNQRAISSTMWIVTMSVSVAMSAVNMILTSVEVSAGTFTVVRMLGILLIVFMFSLQIVAVMLYESHDSDYLTVAESSRAKSKQASQIHKAQARYNEALIDKIEAKMNERLNHTVEELADTMASDAVNMLVATIGTDSTRKRANAHSIANDFDTIPSYANTDNDIDVDSLPPVKGGDAIPF